MVRKMIREGHRSPNCRPNTPKMASLPLPFRLKDILSFHANASLQTTHQQLSDPSARTSFYHNGTPFSKLFGE